MESPKMESPKMESPKMESPNFFKNLRFLKILQKIACSGGLAEQENRLKSAEIKICKNFDKNHQKIAKMRSKRA